MQLRNKADYRTLFWVFILTPGVVGAQYLNPELVPYLSWVSCYFALACGVIAHNHNHCGTFKSKQANHLFGSWLSVFYGYPTFGWIPTHNANHHKFTNAPGDATITWRHTNRHSFWVAITYPFVSSYYQGDLIGNYVTTARERGGKAWSNVRWQYAIWAGGHIVMLAAGIAIHGVKTGMYVWGLSMLVPALFALWTIMLFNYEQHVHTDPYSEHDHSRSFVSWSLNFLLFNNGFHTVHHEHPGTHWSEAPRLHAEIADKIDPVLQQRSLWWYWFRQYFLAAIIPSLGSTQIGTPPMNPPPPSNELAEAT